MINSRGCYGLLVLLFFFPSSQMAQSYSSPPVSKVFALLSKTVESKSASVGDELFLQTISDVVVDGQVIIPQGSKLLAHVAGAITKGKGEPQSILAITVDKAIAAGGGEILLQAIVVAIAAPVDPLSSDPTYGMMHSNEPKMIGSGPQGTANSGGLAASSKASSNAAVATAEIKGHMEPLLLTEDSQGTVGYEGISISWQLTMPPPLTVFASKAKNVKLEAGTQMLLRMASSRVPK